MKWESKSIDEITEVIIDHRGKTPNKSASGIPLITAKIKNGVPSGWELRQLGEIILEIIDYRGKTPKKLGGDWSQEGIRALSALNVKNNRLINLEKCKMVDENLYQKWMQSEI